jgi:segregation and condensation protein B
LRSETVVEAALFSAGKPLKISEISDATGLGSDTVRKAVRKLAVEYNDRDSAMEIVSISSKYVMQLREDLTTSAQKLARTEIPKKYLKTVSLIAYHQPLKQSELVEMVGNKGYEHVRALCGFGLITARPYGATKRLKTTRRFLEYFGIDAKKPEEIKRWLEERLMEG